MTQQDYEQKKRECWKEFKREVQCLPVSRHDVFCAAFDRAYALSKQENDADTVIQGWVARDENGRLCLYQNEPKREAYDFQPRGYWTDKTDKYIDFPPNLFPNITWKSDPQEVEITIKRKKNGH